MADKNKKVYVKAMYGWDIPGKGNVMEYLSQHYVILDPKYTDLRSA